jgi:hypothetical protein
LNTDIWVRHILPFVGIGHFIFVAGVNHQMKHCYNKYCDSMKNPPLVISTPGFFGSTLEQWFGCQQRPATNVHTFRSSVFCSVSCSEYGYGYNASRFPRLQYRNPSACAFIAKTGNLEVLIWARKKNLPWDPTTCSNAMKMDVRGMNSHVQLLLNLDIWVF